MLISERCLYELQHYDRIYCWVSGGKESTAVALALWEMRLSLDPIPVYLIHSNTGLNMKTAKATLQQLREHCYDFEYIELPPEVQGAALKQLLIDSFKQIPTAFQDRQDGKYNREVFPCCRFLKHNPGRTFIKSIPKPIRKRYVFLSSIARYEANRRQLFLSRIKNEDTFTIWNQRMHAYYCYPLRDYGNLKPIRQYLDDQGFKSTVSSGCRICPIVILFDMFDIDPKGFIRSKKFMINQVKGIKFCHQTSMEEF